MKRKTTLLFVIIIMLFLSVFSSCSSFDNSSSNGIKRAENDLFYDGVKAYILNSEYHSTKVIISSNYSKVISNSISNRKLSIWYPYTVDEVDVGTSDSEFYPDINKYFEINFDNNTIVWRDPLLEPVFENTNVNDNDNQIKLSFSWLRKRNDKKINISDIVFTDKKNSNYSTYSSTDDFSIENIKINDNTHLTLVATWKANCNLYNYVTLDCVPNSQVTVDYKMTVNLEAGTPSGKTLEDELAVANKNAKSVYSIISEALHQFPISSEFFCGSIVDYKSINSNINKEFKDYIFKKVKEQGISDGVIVYFIDDRQKKCFWVQWAASVSTSMTIGQYPNPDSVARGHTIGMSF